MAMLDLATKVEKIHSSALFNYNLEVDMTQVDPDIEYPPPTPVGMVKL
jgi:hypothetical protein